MDFKPIYIVDTLAVKPAQQIAMLKLLKEEGIPIMQDAGLELVGCYSTSPDLDEDVLIQVTWKVADHSAFNLIRKDLRHRSTLVGLFRAGEPIAHRRHTPLLLSRPDAR